MYLTLYPKTLCLSQPLGGGLQWWPVRTWASADARVHPRMHAYLLLGSGLRAFTKKRARFYTLPAFTRVSLLLLAVRYTIRNSVYHCHTILLAATSLMVT